MEKFFSNCITRCLWRQNCSQRQCGELKWPNPFQIWLLHCYIFTLLQCVKWEVQWPNPLRISKALNCNKPNNFLVFCSRGKSFSDQIPQQKHIFPLVTYIAANKNIKALFFKKWVQCFFRVLMSLKLEIVLWPLAELPFQGKKSLIRKSGRLKAQSFSHQRPSLNLSPAKRETTLGNFINALDEDDNIEKINVRGAFYNEPICAKIQTQRH